MVRMTTPAWWMWIAGLWLGLAASAPPARGQSLVPLTVTPFSVETVSLAGQALLPVHFEQSGPGGVGSDTVTLNFNDPGFSVSGSVTTTVSVMSDRVIVSGSHQADNSIDLESKVTVTVDIPVPLVGGALTPIHLKLVDVGNSGKPGTVIVESMKDASARGVSLMPGGLSSPTGPTSEGIVFFAPGGETARTTFSVSVQSFLFDPDIVTVATEVQFFTVSTAPGNGDLNGDGKTDIVDSTLLRRLLAGLPP